MSKVFLHDTAKSRDGTQIALKVVGEVNAAHTIILMHGWGSTKDYFDLVVPWLDLSKSRIVLFDLRGHGDSSLPNGPLKVSDFLEDMRCVADHVGAQRFVAGGHSMGAKFVQGLSALMPGRVIGQILIGGTPAGSIEAPDEVFADWAGYAGDMDALLKSHKSIITQPVPLEASLLWVEQAARIDKRVLFESLQLCFRADLMTDQLRACMLPSLAVAGTNDPFFSPDFLRQELMKFLPFGRMVQLDCGHEIPLELPEKLAGLIEAFCAGLTPALATRNTKVNHA